MLFGSNKKLSWQQRLGRKYKYKYFSREYKYKYLKSVFKYSSSTRKVPSRTFCLERPQSKQYLFRQRTHSWFFTVFTVHVDLRRIAADVSKTSYRSSIETFALICLVFEKIAFFCILATDRQTDKQTNKQMDSIEAVSRSRCREWRLNKQKA